MSAEGTISIEGTPMMMDDVTPHTAIVVQAATHNPIRPNRLKMKEGPIWL